MLPLLDLLVVFVNVVSFSNLVLRDLIVLVFVPSAVVLDLVDLCQMVVELVSVVEEVVVEVVIVALLEVVVAVDIVVVVVEVVVVEVGV